MTSILFLCLGNICRSPLAEGVFAHHIKKAGLEDKITYDSAGNGAWHEGDPPDPRAIQVAQKYGVDISNQRSRPLTAQDFDRFDLILAMDEGNIERLRSVMPTNSKAQVALFLEYSTGEATEVPDPYYGGDEGFDRVFAQIDRACQKLVEKLASSR